jgi:hypothetical protein
MALLSVAKGYFGLLLASLFAVATIGVIVMR